MSAELLNQVLRHTPLPDATWTIVRAGRDGPDELPYVEWECIAPACRVHVRPFIAPPDHGMPIETLWQETAVWHPRVNPGDSLREPMVPLLAYVKKLFVGVNREAVVVFPPFREIRDEDAARVSMFTLLGAADRPTTGAARALPAFFTFLPPLP